MECVFLQEEQPAVSGSGSEGQTLTFDLLHGLAEVPGHAADRFRSRDRPDLEDDRSVPGPSFRALAPRPLQGVGAHERRDALQSQLAKRLSGFPITGHVDAGEHGADMDTLVELFKQRMVLDGRGDTTTLRPFGGIITEISCINSSWLPNTARTAEHLHFCKWLNDRPQASPYL